MSRGWALMMAAAACVLGCNGGELKIVSAEPHEFTGGDLALIDIKGRGFQPGAAVWFGEQMSPQTIVASGERIVALTPKTISSGKMDVKVSNPDGKSATLVQAAAFKSRLAVASVEPPFLQVDSAGVEAKLRGTGFMPGARVLFGQAESPAVTVKDDGYLLAKVPELGPGPVDVVVINPDQAQAGLYGGFQVLAPGLAMPLRPFKESAADYGIQGDEQFMDTGVAFADVNQDGFMDLLVSAGRRVAFYLGTREGKLREYTEASGLGEVRNIVYGVFFGDLDNDGLPDAVITGQPVRIFRNLGQARFEDVSQRIGLTDYLKAFCVALADYDRDGLLDLYIGTMADDDRLYHNVSGVLTPAFPDLFRKRDLAVKYGNDQPTTFSAAFADYDQDGYPDLFVGIRGLPAALYHNDRGKGFRDVTIAVGAGKPAPPPEKKPLFKPNWGVTWADFDNDGWLDLFLSSGPLGDDLFKNREGKSFTNVAGQMRVRFSQDNLMGAWGDFDNDGLLDLAVPDNMSGVRVYRGQGDGSFQDVTAALGIENGPRAAPFGTAWVDLNRDGALDLYTVEYATLNRLFMNAPYPGRHWLEVELSGTKSNGMAIGAVVTVQAGSTILTRQVAGGEGYVSAPPPILHFGLGASGKIDKLTVAWPAGEPQVMEQVPADQVLAFVEPGQRKTVTIPAPPPAAPAPGSTVAPGSTAGAAPR